MSTSKAPQNPVETELTQEVDDRAVPTRSLLSRWLSTRAAWILLLDIALIIFFTLYSSGGRFLSTQDIQALLLAGTEGLLLALGLAMLLGSGKFDLSLGANLVLSSVVAAKVMKEVAGHLNAAANFPHPTLAIFAGLAAAVLTGGLFGAVNGGLIAYLEINSLIATLGTLGAATGLALVITGGNDISGLPSQLQANFGLKTVASIPLPAIIAIALAVVFWAIVRYTRFGLNTLAIGSSRYAAERAGLQVRRHVMMLAILAGALAGLAGFVDISRYLTTTVNGHANDALDAVTAVVIGGTLLEGGFISIPGTVWGVGLSVILLGGLDFVGVSSDYQLIATAVVLIVAVSLDRLTFLRRRSS